MTVLFIPDIADCPKRSRNTRDHAADVVAAQLNFKGRSVTTR
jgi:hypothetical protein